MEFEMDTYDRGLQLLRAGKYADARQFLKTVYDTTKASDIRLLFYLGFCNWKCGYSSKATELFQAAVDRIQNPTIRELVKTVVTEIPNYKDDMKILEAFEAALLWQVKVSPPSPPLKDTVILDANFLINVYNNMHILKLLRKTCWRYNLYTSQHVYQELLPLGYETSNYEELQRLLSKSIMRIAIADNVIQALEQSILTKFKQGQSIKQNHIDRPHAWMNDLSLICLLRRLEAPVKYIVTNDRGMQQIVQFLYPDKDAFYYIHSLEDFLASINILIETGEKSVLEQRVYYNSENKQSAKDSFKTN